ncbi:MAG: hypothetical protein DRO88_09925 [Promethearchaeia archaeon]|nr:MAG: hypothetical protein DRO88_09925 [Candidatus Lokiarchaeia archaeon]
MVKKKKVIYHGREFIIELLDNQQIQIDGYVFSPKVVQQAENRFKVTFGKYSFILEKINGKFYLEGEEVDINIRPYIEVENSIINSNLPKNSNVKAPIPGKIFQILVKEQDIVKKGQELLILEAMKMRNRILAPISGKITKIFPKPGDNVFQDQELISIMQNSKE